jgi:hypothetical protein
VSDHGTYDAEHHCPLCGVLHGGVSEGEIVDGLDYGASVEDGEQMAIARAELEDDDDVAIAALQAMRDVAIAGEETRRTEAEADAMVDVVEAIAEAEETAVEEASEVGIAEAIADEADEPPAGITADAGEELPPVSTDEVDEDELGNAPTAVAVPPQIHDADEGKRPTSSRRVSAFRSHRARGGRR